MVGIEGEPLKESKKASLVVKPWYASTNQMDAEFWILPKESQWSPILPSPGEMVTPVCNSLNATLADPEYWKAQ